MVFKMETKITQNKNIQTQYVTIPASIIRASRYPFKVNKKVKIITNPYHKNIIIASDKGPIINVSSKGVITNKRRMKIVEK